MSKHDERAKASSEESADLVEQIGPLFAGVNPEVIGAMLAELAATHLGGLHPKLRENGRKLMIELMDRLMPIIIEEMIEGGYAPPEWRGQTKR